MRLEFKLVNPEDEPTFPIVCATKEFAITRDVSEPNFEHAVEIVGTIVPTKQQGRVLLTFKAKIHHRENNEGIDVSFSAKGKSQRIPDGIPILRAAADVARNSRKFDCFALPCARPCQVIAQQRGYNHRSCPT